MEGGILLNKDEFYSMEPDVRVNHINKMLLNRSLNEVAKEIGIPSSSFSKEMTNGDYVYIKRENQYYKFVRDLKDVQSSITNNDTTLYLNQNIKTIKEIVSLFQHHTPLILDEKIYSKQSTYTTKSLKMNSLVYSEFVEFCENNYPLYRLQDLVAQALLDFIQRYRKNREPE